MREFIEFCLLILKELISSLFAVDIGGYSFGAFLTTTIVISVFISSLVIRFRNTDVQAPTRPPKNKGKKG